MRPAGPASNSHKLPPEEPCDRRRESRGTRAGGSCSVTSGQLLHFLVPQFHLYNEDDRTHLTGS